MRQEGGGAGGIQPSGPTGARVLTHSWFLTPTLISRARLLATQARVWAATAQSAPRLYKGARALVRSHQS